MRFSVITPTYNSGSIVRDTIESVLSQSIWKQPQYDLEYIIMDADSSDESIQIIKEYEGEGVQLISEKDEGMYDALAKAFQKVSGDIVCYINAGDIFFNSAFSVVATIFEKFNYIHWLTGMAILYNENAEVIRCHYPFRYLSKFFQFGLYLDCLPVLQQESTFWRHDLLNLLDLNQLSRFRYAGDYYLWKVFSMHHRLYVVESFLGGFRLMDGQLSSNREAYRKEVQCLASKTSILYSFKIFLEKLLWILPRGVSRRIAKVNDVVYDINAKEWVSRS